MKKQLIYIFALLISGMSYAQDSDAKKLLDEVSTKMTSYKNMQIDFSSVLVNREAGINENDEPPINGNIAIAGDKYNLNYLGSNFVYDGQKLYVINHDEKEVSVNDEDLDDDSGFIYPSKLFTFYKEGYNYKLDRTVTIKGKVIQFVVLTPIDSNSEIVKVELGIEKKTKHIYMMTQVGANGAVTTFKINNFKGDKELSNNIFSFDRAKYKKLNYLID